MPWQSRTPSNTPEFGSQSKLVRDSFVRSPKTAQEGFSKLVKGAEEMLHENVLIKARVRELEEQLAAITKRKARKRKRIQTSETMEFSAGASYVTENLSVARTVSKKAGVICLPVFEICPPPKYRIALHPHNITPAKLQVGF
jgi:hypothetical protein